MHEEIQNLAFIVDGARQLIAPPLDDDHNLVEMSVVTRLRSIATQIMGDRSTKLQKPAPGSFMGNIQTTLWQQILNIAIAQNEASIEPYGKADNFGWEAIALEGNVLHAGMLLRSNIKTPVQLT